MSIIWDNPWWMIRGPVFFRVTWAAEGEPILATIRQVHTAYLNDESNLTTKGSMFAQINIPIGRCNGSN
jgi:hypothetical protein